MATFQDLGIDLPSGAHGEVDTLCPWCSHKRKREHQRIKCLSVNTDLGVYFCNHCGESGKAFVDGNSYGAPLPKEFKRPEPIPEDASYDSRTVAWFSERGIEQWALDQNRISVGMAYSPAAGKEVRAIRFPYYRDGELINIKYRGHPKSFWMVGGAERILYGLDDIKDAPIIIIVEGEMDKLSFDSINGWPCVSVPDGAPTPNTKNYASKFSFLSGVAEEYLRAAETVIIAVDTDEPGNKLADELARRIGYEKCKRIFWPAPYKDANEVLVNLGKDALAQLLADAQPYPVSGIVTVREIFDSIDSIYEHGYPRGYHVGFEHLSEHYRPEKGLMTVVTGSPGSGKSTVIDNIVVKLAELHDWKFGVCSPENQPFERHAAGLMSIRAGKPFDAKYGDRMSREEMQYHRRWLEQHFTFVLPDEPSMESILEKMEVLVYREGIDAFLIDPWNELDHSRQPGVSLTQQVNAELTLLRTFIRKSKTHAILVAHPTKLQKDKDGKYPVATMYDISDSAHFYNKTDFGISVWRDASDIMLPTEIHVQKVRFREMGETGMVEVTYDYRTQRITEVPKPRLPVVFAPRETAP